MIPGRRLTPAGSWVWIPPGHTNSRGLPVSSVAWNPHSGVYCMNQTRQVEGQSPKTMEGIPLCSGTWRCCSLQTPQPLPCRDEVLSHCLDSRMVMGSRETRLRLCPAMAFFCLSPKLVPCSLPPGVVPSSPALPLTLAFLPDSSSERANTLKPEWVPPSVSLCTLPSPQQSVTLKVRHTRLLTAGSSRYTAGAPKRAV